MRMPLKPTLVANTPALAASVSQETVTQLSGWPGVRQMPPFTLRPFTSISTMSSVLSLSVSAVLGLICTALSQQTCVIGLGVSCSHALFA